MRSAAREVKQSSFTLPLTSDTADNVKKLIEKNYTSAKDSFVII